MPGKIYNITYQKDVVRSDIPSLSKKDAHIIKEAIEKKIAIEPDAFGKPLRKPLAGYWSLRVGSYRVIYSIHKDVVTIWHIKHRKEAYKQ